MWILRFFYCLFEGHAFVDITTAERPYQFCLRCGKIKEPTAVRVRSRSHLNEPVPVRVRIDR
jgi:hypothetical protein